MMPVAIAAAQVLGGTPVVATSVTSKAAAFGANAASDAPLAQKLLDLGRNETGRLWTGSAWRTYEDARANDPALGGGSIEWSSSAQLDQVRASANTLAVVPPAPAPGTGRAPIDTFQSINICMRTIPVFRDDGTEAYVRSNTAARAALTSAKIYSNISILGLPYFNGQLDTNGCAVVQTKNNNYCFQFELSSALIGTGATRFKVQSNGVTNTFTTSLCVLKNTLTNQYPSTFSWGPSGTSPGIAGMAVAARIATMPDPGFTITSTTPHIMEMTAGCPSYPAKNAAGALLGYNGEACYQGSNDTAYFGPALSPSPGNLPLNFHTTIDKFVVGHELGHMQQKWSTGDSAIAYPFETNQLNGRPASCACLGVVSANRAHCLNSREYSSPAQSEGWAHFFSAKVMNDPAAATCNFSYYKELYNGPTAVKLPPVFTNCKAPVKWRNNNCPLAESATEWDWLTFLTNVHTNGVDKLSIAEIADVYQRACGTSGTPCAGGEMSWDTTTPQISSTIARRPLRPAALAKFGLTSPKFTQWIQRADQSGVSNSLAP
jgi:hypothetical protein